MTAKMLTFPFKGNLKSQLFTAGGSFTVPAGVNLLFITGVAPGGGGTSGQARVSTGTNQTYSSGGGGGQSALRFPIEVTPAESLTVSIGSVGAGGTGPTRSTDGITYGTNGSDAGNSGLYRSGVIIFRLMGGLGGTWATSGFGAGGTLNADVEVENFTVGGDGGCNTATAGDSVGGNIAGNVGAQHLTYGYPGRPGGCSLFGSSGDGGDGLSLTTTPSTAYDAIDGVGFGYGGSAGGSASTSVAGGTATAGSGGDGGPSFLLLEWYEV